MKLPSLSFKKSSPDSDSQTFVAVDLTQNSVKAICFNIDQPPGQPVTSPTSHQLQVKGVSLRSSYDSQLKPQIISKTIEESLQQSAMTGSRIILGLSGEKVFGFILIAKIKRDAPDKEINTKELDAVYEKLKASAIEQAKQRWSAYFASEADFEPLDLVITSTLLDGNIKNDLIGSTGEYIQMGVFCSYAEKGYYSKIVKSVEDYEILAVTTTLYSQVKLLAEAHKNFILVDIGGNQTDVAVIFGESIIQTRSFEVGGEYFSQHLAKNLGHDIHSARGKKEAYTINTLADDEADKVGDLLYEAGKDWRLALETILTSMQGIKSFPKQIILTGGGANQTILQELLYEEEWHKAIPFAGELEIEVAGEKDFKGYIKDDLNLLKGPGMFAPSSLGIIRLELDWNNNGQN